jgi:hypothetical protein
VTPWLQWRRDSSTSSEGLAMHPGVALLALDALSVGVLVNVQLRARQPEEFERSRIKMPAQ